MFRTVRISFPNSELTTSVLPTETVLNFLDVKMSSYFPPGVLVYGVIVPASPTVSDLIPTWNVLLSAAREVESPLTRTVSLSLNGKPNPLSRLYAETCLSLSHSRIDPSKDSLVVLIKVTPIPINSDTEPRRPDPPDSLKLKLTVSSI